MQYVCWNNEANNIHTNISHHLYMTLKRQRLGEAGPYADLMCITHNQ